MIQTVLSLFGAAVVLTAQFPSVCLNSGSSDGFSTHVSREFNVTPGEYLISGEVISTGRCFINGGASVVVKYPGVLPSLWYGASSTPCKTDGKAVRVNMVFRVLPEVKKARVHFELKNFIGKAEFRNFKVEKLPDVSPYRVYKDTGIGSRNVKVDLLPSKAYIASGNGKVVFYDIYGRISGTAVFEKGRIWHTPASFAGAELICDAPFEIRQDPCDNASFSWRNWNSHTMIGPEGKGSVFRDFELRQNPEFAVLRLIASGADVYVNGVYHGRNNGKVIDGDKCYIDIRKALKAGKNRIELRFVRNYPKQTLQLDCQMIFPDGSGTVILASDGRWFTGNGKALEFNTSPYRAFLMFDKPWLLPPEMPDKMYNYRKVSSSIRLDLAQTARGNTLAGVLTLIPEESLFFPYGKIALDIYSCAGGFCWRTWCFPKIDLKSAVAGKKITVPFKFNTSVLKSGKYTIRPVLPGSKSAAFEIGSGTDPVPQPVWVDFSRSIPGLRVGGRLIPATLLYSRNFYDPSAYGRCAELDYNQYAESGGGIISATAELGFDQEKGASIRLGSIWTGQNKYDYSRLDADIRRVLSGAPDSKIMLMLSCDVPSWFKKSHPEENIVLADGSRHHSPSMASDIWADATASAIEKTVRYLAGQPYCDRIIGVFLVAGFDGQWLNYHNYRKDPWIYGDYSPRAVEAFRGFLRKKYGNDVNALRKAWNDPEITFEKASIPDAAERMAADQYYPDPRKTGRKIDYRLFSGELTSKRVDQFCRAIKRGSRNKWLAGTYYIPNHGETARQGQEYRSESRKLPPSMDFAAQPQLYDNRELHNIGITQNGVSRKFANDRKLWMFEDDNRTFMLDYPVLRWGNYSVFTTTASTLRHIGQRLALGRGHWFFDIMGNSFSTPVMHELMAWERRIEQAALRFLPLPQLAAGAVQVEVHRHLDHKRNNTHEDLKKLHFYSFNDTVSYPVDDADFDCLGASAMPEYRMYIFNRQFYLDAESRKKIEALKKNGNVLVFTGDSGLSDGQTVSAENMSAVTGIKLRDADGGNDARIDWKFAGTDHPLLRGIAGEWAVTGHSFRRFEIADKDAEIIGYYADGKPAAAVKEVKGCTIVYIPTCKPDTLLPPGLGKNLAEKAGIHNFQKAGDPLVIRAGGRFISVYCSLTSASAAVVLPAGIKGYEVMSGKVFSGEVPLKMKQGESRLFFCGSDRDIAAFAKLMKNL